MVIFLGVIIMIFLFIIWCCLKMASISDEIMINDK